MSSKTFTLTGRHVLVILIGFFAVVFAANAAFITFAIESFPGEQEKKSYLQGLGYNQRIAERNAQAALGWTAQISNERDEAGAAVVRLYFRTADGSPIGGLSVSGVIARPADDDADATLDFVENEPGVYVARIDATPGLWRLDAVAQSVRGEKFSLEKRLLLQ